MSSTLDKLNLKPGEKRLLVVIGLVIFVVLNVLYIWPRFSEWGEIGAEIEQASTDMNRYQQEIDKVPVYRQRLDELQEQGLMVMDQDQALQLQTSVQSQALASGVTINRYNPVSRSTSNDNPFFDEQAIVVTFVTGDEELVNFLVNLAANESMIRVRDLDLRPDRTQQKLQGNLTLVASYQKNESQRP